MRRRYKKSKKSNKRKSSYDSDSDTESDAGNITVDYDRRVIYITDEITFYTSDNFVCFMDILEQRSKKEITVKMSSGGGYVEAALSIYDRINESELHIKFIGYGTIMSAALIIMCCCDERYIYENTRLMWHASSNDLQLHETSPERIEIESKEIIYLEEITNKILSHHTNMSKKFWGKVKNELYFGADEAVKMKLADKIISGVRHNFIDNKPDSKFEDKLLLKCKC
jgi:ATP-dependent Clp endopeptidase proteolytic subunit ClpP